MQIVAEEKVREDLDSEAEGPRDKASEHWRMSLLSSAPQELRFYAGITGRT
jgi:hypothetical protein